MSGVGAWFSDTKQSVSDSLNLLPGSQPSYCPSMSYTQRLYGFAICLGVGVLIALLSCIFIFTLNFVAFGVMYTLGNLFWSLVLPGVPKKVFHQIKSMCQPVRLLTTIAYFVLMGLTLFAAIYLQSGLLTLLFVFLQFCALVWYTLSFIPGARQCLCSCFKTSTGLDEA